MSKVCLDHKTVYGLGAILAGAVFLLLAYFQNFLSLIVVIVAFGAITNGVISLGLVQRAVAFFKGFLKK